MMTQTHPRAHKRVLEKVKFKKFQIPLNSLKTAQSPQSLYNEVQNFLGLESKESKKSAVLSKTGGGSRKNFLTALPKKSVVRSGIWQAQISKTFQGIFLSHKMMMLHVKCLTFNPSGDAM